MLQTAVISARGPSSELSDDWPWLPLFFEVLTINKLFGFLLLILTTICFFVAFLFVFFNR